MLYNVIKRLIAKKQTEGLDVKIDVLFASGRLTEKEYNALIKELNKGAQK